MAKLIFTNIINRREKIFAKSFTKGYNGYMRHLQDIYCNYSPTSIAELLKNSVKKAGIHKNVTPSHLLRHSSLRMAEIYTHVSKKAIDKIKSPVSDFLRKER